MDAMECDHEFGLVQLVPAVDVGAWFAPRHAQFIVNYEVFAFKENALKLDGVGKLYHCEFRAPCGEASA
jgi:hypothetical protein